MAAEASAAPGPAVVATNHPGGVRLLRLNRPDTGNALTDEVLHALLRAVREALADRMVRAAVLTGGGPAFCTGADLGQLRSSLDRPGGPAAYWRPRLDVLADLIRTVTTAEIPVVCAMNGQAAGSGLALALSCDLRLAAERAAVNVAYGALGSSTDAGFVWLLVRAVGPGIAARLLLEQPILRAREARELGLVGDVVPADHLLTASLRLAAHAGSAARHAVAAAKRLLRTAGAMPIDTHMALEHEEFLAGLETTDVRRGIAARAAGRFATFNNDRPAGAPEADRDQRP